MKTSMFVGAALFAAVSFTTAPPAAAAAAADDAYYARTIHYDDLDISTKSGAKALLARIRIAARAVCTSGSEPTLLNASRSYRACVSRAEGKAVAGVSNPVVQALYSNAAAQIAAK